MINILIGDIFESKAQTLVNTVNCVGVMGKGIALEFKKHFPEMYKDYVEKCQRKEVVLGRPYLYKSLFEPFILNFPTKDHWRSVSRLEDIINGLEYVIEHYKEWGITSLAVPPLGCGEGQLEWKIVGPTLYRYLNRINIPIELYAPYGTAQTELQHQFLCEGLNNKIAPVKSNKRIDPAWLALVEIVNRIKKQPYHWPIGRTIFQKIAFVATNEGLPTGLKFEKGSYGPYSSDLKQLITKLVNNGLIEEERLGQMFSIKVGPTYMDAYKAFSTEINQYEQIINKTVDLFARMRTNQAEVTASVLYSTYLLSKENSHKPTELDVLSSVMNWKQRHKPPIEEKEVASTIRNLAALKWLDVNPSKELPVSDD